MPKYFATALTTLFFLSACESPRHDDFVGKWVHVKSERRTMEIFRNGDGYIVRNAEASMTSGKFDVTNIPATMNDSSLQINNGFGTVVFVVDRSTGHLTSAIGEFRKTN